jgi:hypothetical protein
LTVFHDDFERANGALGGNWVAITGSPTIVSGAVQGTGHFGAFDTTVSDNHRLEASAQFQSVDGNSFYSAVATNLGSGANYGYSCRVQYNAPSYYLRLYKGNPGTSPTLLAETQLAAGPGLVYQLRLVNTDGHLVASFGSATAEADDAQYAALTNCGVRGWAGSTRCLEFSAVGGAAVAFQVSPTTIGNYGLPTSLTFTGTNTSWTPGTPGSPTFTADHGTLSSQVVASATSATVSYTPGAYLGTVVFTDPSTGATATAVVTSDPTVVPIAGAALTQSIVQYLQRSADDVAESVILNRNKTLPSSGNATDPLGALKFLYDYEELLLGGDPGNLATNALMAKVWRILNGGWGPPAAAVLAPTDVPIAHNVDALHTRLVDLVTSNQYTLGTVITTITGEGVPTIKDVVDAIADLQVGGSTDLTPVTDAIAALRGDTTTTVAELLDVLGQIRTIHTYSLGDVVDAIGQLNNASNAPVLAAIAAMGVAVAASFTAEEASVAAVGTEVASVGAGVVGLAATLLELAGSLAQILELLQALPTEAPPAGPPAWPGSTLVQLGSPVDLTAGLTVTTPMDGLIVEITSVAPKQMFYTYHDVRSYRHIGALAFFDDEGHLEGYQALGFTSAIYTPRSLVRAEGVKVMSAPGTAGTVTPWLRS